MTTIELLDNILRNLQSVGGIEASIIASRDGLLMSSKISGIKNQDTFVAMSATMLGAAETATAELGKGVPNRIIIESKHGKVIVMGAGPKGLLIIITAPDAGLGLILMEAAKASDKVRQILGK